MDKNILVLVKKVAEVVVAVIDICSEEQEDKMYVVSALKTVGKVYKVYKTVKTVYKVVRIFVQL